MNKESQIKELIKSVESPSKMIDKLKEAMGIPFSYEVLDIVKSIAKPSTIYDLISEEEIRKDKIEFCNEMQRWKEDSSKISCWMGKPDDGYFSPPDGEDMPKDDIYKLIQKWEVNWEQCEE